MGNDVGETMDGAQQSVSDSAPVEEPPITADAGQPDYVLVQPYAVEECIRGSGAYVERDAIYLTRRTSGDRTD